MVRPTAAGASSNFGDGNDQAVSTVRPSSFGAS